MFDSISYFFRLSGIEIIFVFRYSRILLTFRPSWWINTGNLYVGYYKIHIISFLFMGEIQTSGFLCKLLFRYKIYFFFLFLLLVIIECNVQYHQVRYSLSLSKLAVLKWKEKNGCLNFADKGKTNYGTAERMTYSYSGWKKVLQNIGEFIFQSLSALLLHQREQKWLAIRVTRTGKKMRKTNIFPKIFQIVWESALGI